jgi:hypothetical protein
MQRRQCIVLQVPPCGENTDRKREEGSDKGETGRKNKDGERMIKRG